VTERYSTVILTTGGYAGLQAYITELYAVDFQIVMAGNIEYHVYDDGTVTTSTGDYLTSGGVDGLTAYLQAAAAPDYQIVNAGGVQYHLYTNGSSFDTNG